MDSGVDSQRPPASDVTTLIERARAGDRASAEALLPVVYDQLRVLAAQAMARERSDHTLQATALVHEAYARLVGNDELDWDHRGHFFRAAAEAMRRILVEHARARSRLKRGGPDRRRQQVDLNLVELACGENNEEFLSFERVFRRLCETAPDVADVARLRLFAGLTVEQVAGALGISVATVKRRWTYARAWLQREVASEDPSTES
jgi:RNA polymerase sigma factor (TIGR02999 family)